MPLTSGTKLGPYEIQSSLGAGGMGEVYRARDTRLERIVAIKILPEAFSADPDRLHRFQHEARVLSTLNHPNVLAIYDVGEQNGIPFLVSEFLEGQTLRETLASGVLPRRKVTEHALEIARGLAAAHEKGIVHRDLKPDNIFITRDDRVKILDFGLAKQPAKEIETEEATMTAPVPTTPGTLMGTVGYMSPEQVRGQPLDHRTDIFSFGAVLYEMTSGKRAFHGDSSVETMNAILKEDVAELSVSTTQVSPGLERIIRRCLEKKPERRFQSASDLAFALDALSATSSISQPLPGVSRVGKTRRRLAWISAVVVLVALLAAGAWLLQRSPSNIANFQQISFRPSYIRTARFAPGRTVVYAASINGEPMDLFSTRTDTFESQPLNLHADLLSVSRSSELALSLGRVFQVLWTPTGRLAKAPLGGGATRELLDDVIDADWNKDGSELAVARRVGNQFRLEYPAGTVLYETAGYVSDIRFSPSGDQIAFIDHELVGDDRGTVSSIDLQGHRRVLTRDFESAQGLAWKGTEIWFTASDNGELSSLREVDLRGRTRQIAAAPVRMHLEDIADDGLVLLSSEGIHLQTGVGDRQSGRLQDLSAFEYETLGNISDDGKMISLNSFDIGGDTSYRLYIQKTDGSPPVLVGHGAGTGFSRDGSLLSAIDPAHPDNVFIIPSGVGEARTLHAPPGRYYGGVSFFPDGKRLLITTISSGQSPESAVQDLETGAIHTINSSGKYVAAYVYNLFPGSSPDGKYCIETDGKGHNWLQPIEGGVAREISGIGKDDNVINWHDDSNNIFLSHQNGADLQIDTLNLGSEQRRLWTTFSPQDKTALTGNRVVLITPDGAHFAYQVFHVYSTLFVASGLQ